jgi:hypothetical protein
MPDKARRSQMVAREMISLLASWLVRPAHRSDSSEGLDSGKNGTANEAKHMLYASPANAVIGICETPTLAEEAVMELQRRGFDMTQVSIVGRDDHAEKQVVGYYTTGESVSYWGKMGAFQAGLRGWWRAGTGLFVVPGLGPTLVAGPLVVWIVSALEGAFVFEGLSAIGAAFYNFGIPKDKVLRMEAALKDDQFLVIMHGTASEAGDARKTLIRAGVAEVLEYLAGKDEYDNAA